MHAGVAIGSSGDVGVAHFYVPKHHPFTGMNKKIQHFRTRANPVQVLLAPPRPNCQPCCPTLLPVRSYAITCWSAAGAPSACTANGATTRRPIWPTGRPTSSSGVEDLVMHTPTQTQTHTHIHTHKLTHTHMHTCTHAHAKISVATFTTSAAPANLGISAVCLPELRFPVEIYEIGRLSCRFGLAHTTEDGVYVDVCVLCMRTSTDTSM